MKAGRKHVVLWLVACLWALALPSAAFAAASGTFTPTGQMGTARAGPAVAPLPDGRVLVAGGWDGSTWLDTAEVFNPATDTFSPVSSLMTVGRQGAAAVQLGNGRVLIAGGYNPGLSHPWLQSSELFNPTNNSFSPVSDMSVVRSGPAGAPLPNGKALIAGGFDSVSASSIYRKTAEIFTGGSTNSYSTAVGSMAVGRAAPTASPLPDGRVLVAGGTDGPSDLNNAEIFNAATNGFTSAGGQMGIGREDAVSAPMPDGRVLIAGGTSLDVPQASAEVFDPATGSFSSAGVGSLGTARFGAGAAPLPDGRVLVVGGQDAGLHPLRTAEIYSLTPPSISFSVRGKRLLFDAPVAGTLSVSGGGGKKAVAAKKRKNRRLLKPASASGGPGTIVLKLKPLGAAKQRLRQKGKVRIRATLQFTPTGTSCVPTFTLCYSYASSRTAKLKVKLKRK